MAIYSTDTRLNAYTLLEEPLSKQSLKRPNGWASNSQNDRTE